MEDEKPSFLEAEENESLAASASSTVNHGWQKVVYPKRHRRQAPPPSAAATNGHLDPPNIFSSVEQKGQERRRAIESTSAAAEARSRPITAAASDDEDEDSGAEARPGGQENEMDATKKAKPRKPKKPKVTVAEAAAKVDESELAAFLADVSASFESQPDIQLMRFADYFGRAFASVSASQFPWTKMFKESPVAKIIDIPLCHISESVYRTSVNWITLRPPEALGDFILWCLDGILSDLASHQAAAKGSKKSAVQSPSKGQVAIFVVLAMTLRSKPDVLLNLLPKLRENPKYQGQEKLPVIIWTIAQASQGDLVVGMYLWVHYLFPLISGKSGNNPQSRDLVLQLVERILSGPKARPVLLNGAVRKGERLVSPSALDLLMRATFPSSSARLKATERFVAVYPFLKELALAGAPGTKTTKQASQQLLPLVVKAMQENNPELVNEAIDVFVWCLTQNIDCYCQWEKLHLDNVTASVAVLQKLLDEWKQYSVKLAPLDALRETLMHLRAKNEEALSGSVAAGDHAAIKDADKYCKAILGRLTRHFGCGKFGVFSVTLLVATGAFILAPKMESWDLKELLVMFNIPLSL